MDFNATIDLIIKDLEESREIIDDLKKYPGVPVLQIELAKSKCRSAGELIALLKNVKENTQPQAQQQILKEKKMPVRPAKTDPPGEDKKNEAITNDIVHPPVVKKEESENTRKKVHESTILADKFSHLSNRFNEQIGSMKSDEDVSGMLKAKQLTSLSEAIGVNDRFLFIREIFNGNNEAYHQAISRLENAGSLKDARAVIMSYTGDSNENEAVLQLLDLVKRKLPSNE